MARISGVLDLKSKTTYGMTSRGIPMYLFTPLNPDFPQMICGCSVKSSKNILVVAEKINDDRLPRGQILHFIGECGDYKAEANAIHYAYSPYYWTKFPSIIEPDASKRRILDVETINIDPEGCVDIDDCIAHWDKHWAIIIADVAEWIRVNPWMENASKIGQTLYKDGNPVRKLFPNEYQMSLIPNEYRLGFALIFDWEVENIFNIRFEEVLIKNKKSYTYENAHEWKYANRLKRICEYIAQRSLADSHEWIETLMIFYNKQAAACLAELGSGLLRGHTAPNQEKLEHYLKIGLPAHLAYSSATYEYATQNIIHWGLNSLYCHATSPIRRWADCINQMTLKGMKPNDFKDQCNNLQKYSKKHERDLLFLDVVHSKKELYGIVVNSKRIWCIELSRMITCENTELTSKMVQLEYFYDANKPTWKRRMVFRIKA